MSKISDLTKITTADASPLHQHPAIYSDHFTSQCFMRPAPIACIENIPKRKANIKVESFGRFQPMPRAVFGRANVYNRAFFVPFRTVYRHYNEFIVSSPSSIQIGSTGVQGNVPTISNDELLEFIQDGAFVEAIDPDSEGFNEKSYDFVFDGGSIPYNPIYYKLTDQGVFAYKVLRSLGYPIFWKSGISKTNSQLPLLCYIKVILDWYYPSAFAYSDIYAYFTEYFENCTSVSGIDPIKLRDFFVKIAYCSYNQDYFTSSWTNPVGPSSTNFELKVSIPDITNNTSGSYEVRQVVTNNPSSVNGPSLSGAKPNNGTPFVGSSFVGNGVNTQVQGVLTQYVIDALRSLTDYTVRHRLSGVRAIDRTFSEWGINLSSEIAKRSYYTGYAEFPAQFGDQMSTADTDGARLGDYAGKGIAYDRGSFSYDAYAERGMYVIINSVIPQVGYYQGYDRHVDHIDCLDFYHGDFDHLGVQAVSLGEIWNTHVGHDFDKINSVFSYVPRYGEYLVYNDHVTGLPSLNSCSTQYEGMYLQRNLDLFKQWIDDNELDFTQRLEFVLARDYMQFNRLFYNHDQSDNIDFIHHFTIDFIDTAKDLFDVYDFEKQYNAVKMNINGTNLQ